MKELFNQKLSKYKIIISLIFISLIIISFLLFIYLYPRTKITIRGILKDSSTNKLITDPIFIKIENKMYKIENGVFEIKDVPRFGIMEISGGGLFRPIKVEIKNRKYIEILINRDLAIVLEEFFRNLKFRRFRQNYKIIHPIIKSKIPEDDFLKRLNGWFDKKLKENIKIKEIEFYYSHSKNNLEINGISKNFEICNKIDIKWFIERMQGLEKINEIKITNTYFCKQNNQWFWIYDESFLF